jgi:hypothetical protein
MTVQVIETDKIPYSLVTRKNRPGRVHRKLVREGEVSPGVGFTADLVRYEGGQGVFTAPRHQHNFDQIRYVISGRPDFGNGQLAEGGQVAYFPAGAPYGPEMIEEAELMLIQWSDQWMTREAHDATYVEMQKVGEFRDGYYITVDAEGKENRSDSRNAVWETFMKRNLIYPTPRYPQPLLMEPRGFQWRQNGDGVSVKTLGRFTEDDVYLASYRWDLGGRLALTSERTQLLWVSSGQVSVNGTTLGPRTLIFSDFRETVEVQGASGAEAVCFGMPVPSSSPLPFKPGNV